VFRVRYSIQLDPSPVPVDEYIEEISNDSTPKSASLVAQSSGSIYAIFSKSHKYDYLSPTSFTVRLSGLAPDGDGKDSLKYVYCASKIVIIVSRVLFPSWR
jgi:hypothetical protein